MTQEKLAVLGGPRAVPEGFAFHTWPAVDEDDEKLVLASLRQGNHCTGPHVEMLSKEFAEWNGNTFCVPTNAGTAALHMCVAGCGVKAGDEVITPALSWTSSATCVIHHNAIPIFVDVDWDTMTLDPEKIEAAVTERTRAILVVHYCGIACDMGAILEVARRHGLKVIEDACQAPGALSDGRKVGTIGDCGAFSLNQNKNLCGGEGGFFVSNDEEIFNRGKLLMAFGDMRPAGSGRDYHAYGLGWMYRTSDLPAAFALAQLRKLDRTNAWAQENWHRLDGLLEGTPHMVRPYSSDQRPTNGYAYCPRTDPSYAKERGVSLSKLTDAMCKALAAEGTPFSRANWMLPAHGVFQGKNAYGKGSPWTELARSDISYELGQWPVTQDCIDTCMWNINLHRPPNGPDQVDALARAIRKVYENLDHVTVEEKQSQV